jgi:hypothetical protein
LGRCLNELLLEIGRVMVVVVAYSHHNLSPRRIWRCEAEMGAKPIQSFFMLYCDLTLRDLLSNFGDADQSSLMSNPPKHCLRF